ncbi:hypothetical protein PROFUN_15845 [Planoprotostelium fungivorum]|uniref:Uncharacterized protein n=1 Tax=Planoprotostelium fungivorum TaxID=1890364 RepID=A0A2P6MUB9_9EUKA|nr:hypothetical protein PROFUN_15845 [Planoprotostelium fungivorum]
MNMKTEDLTLRLDTSSSVDYNFNLDNFSTAEAEGTVNIGDDVELDAFAISAASGLFNYPVTVTAAQNPICQHDAQVPTARDRRETKWEEEGRPIPDRCAGAFLSKCPHLRGKEGKMNGKIKCNPTSTYQLLSRTDEDSIQNEWAAATSSVYSVDMEEYTDESDRLFVKYNEKGANIGLYCCSYVNCRKLVPAPGPKLLLEKRRDGQICLYTFNVLPGGRRSDTEPNRKKQRSY